MKSAICQGLAKSRYTRKVKLRENLRFFVWLCATTLFCSVFLFGCKTDSGNSTLGNKFVDTFYSFNNEALKSLLASAPQSQPEILYYQKWAECAHYTVMDRSRFFERNDSTVVMPVTVKDDLMGALAIDFNVTDTFHITIRNKQIVNVRTSSNDLEDYYQAKEWVKLNRPEYIEKQCEGIWEGGPTPCECVQGMVKGFKEFHAKDAK